jgi:Tol biopolymer transport system component
MSRTKLRTIVALAIISLFLFAITVFAQQNTREIFERARMLDESNQNLSEAIKLYGQVVSQSNEQRALAARAQYRIGVLYERMGRKAEAQRAYQIVVKQYGDSDVAGRARAKLPAPIAKADRTAKPRSAGSEATTPITRQLWSGPYADTEGTLSPDGRYLSFVDKKGQGDIAIRDLITGESRRVTNDGNGHCPECGYESIWSPDGKQLAYGWLTKENDEKYKYEALELRIIRADGSAKRVLYRPEGPIYVWPFDWSSDGKYILAGLQEEVGAKEHLRIAMISVTDGSLRIVKTLDNWNWRLSKTMFFSPDDRYIVYSATVKEDSPARDIFLLSTDGSREIPLVQRAADDYALGWTQDGRGLVFLSDHSGTFDMWLVPVVDGQTQGYPELIKHNVGKIEPMGPIKKGSLLFSGGSNSSDALIRDVYIATVDPNTGKVVADPRPAIHRYVGSNFIPAWSPDGHQLAIRSWTKPVNTPGPAILSLVNVETGSERELRPNLPSTIGGFHWSHDGRFLFIAGRNDKNEKVGQGIYKIDAQTGETSLLIPAPEDTWIQYPISSPDGKVLFYLSSKGAIMVRNLETGEDRTLFEARSVDDANRQAFLLSSLALSRDGQWLAFRYQKSDDDASLMVMPAHGGEAREIFQASTSETINTARSIAWTPDARYLLFAMKTRRTDPYQLWRVPIGGGKPENLGLTRTELSNLSMNPDGRRIAFAAAQTVNREVWVMENFLPAAKLKNVSRR